MVVERGKVSNSNIRFRHREQVLMAWLPHEVWQAEVQRLILPALAGRLPTRTGHNLVTVVF
jgi:hypothetical protein